MRRHLLIVLCLFLLGWFAFAQEGFQGPDPAAPRAVERVLDVPLPDVPSFIGWVEDEFVVEFLPEAARHLNARSTVSGRPLVDDLGIQAILDGYGVERFARQFQGARMQSPDSPFPDLTGYFKVKLPQEAPLDDVMNAFTEHPDVDHVEKIGIHTLFANPSNDTYYRNPPPSFPNDQWHLWDTNSIQAEDAWDLTTGSTDVLVGILDSGTRYYHIDIGGWSVPWGPDNPFAGGNVFINPGETPGNGIDDDGNGFVDDTVGWDFVSSAGGRGVSCIDDDCSGVDNDPDDTNGHGTHTAGTMSAITNNGLQVAGVAGGFAAGGNADPGNGCKLVSMRIGYHARIQGFVTGVVRMDWAAEAMNYMAGLVDDGHNVAAINCSWGSSNSGGLNAAVDNLLAHDVMVIAAAGNSNSSSPDFLGGKAGVMNVAATAQNGTGASFTNHGSWVDVAAPGVDILSTYRNPDDPDPAQNYIALQDGTSMSAPHVAGIAALLESCDSSLSRTDKFNLIVGNTIPYNDGRDLGSGIADANAALIAAGNCGGTPCDVTAAFSGSPTSGCASLNVSFTDQSSGSPTSWTWDFGDGNGSNAQNPSHTYTAAGNYTVSLTATNATCSDTLTQTAYVSVSDAPVANFSGSPTSGNNPLLVNFTDSSSGNPTSWTWTFGDGNGSSAQNPSHTYTAAGLYTVSLTVSNACGGDSLTLTDYIMVEDPPPSSTMHVSSIVLDTANQGGGNKAGQATVTIVDNAGNPVAGVSVSGDFTGDVTGSASGTTNGSGVAVLVSPTTNKGRTNFTFCVTNVSGGSLTYEPGDNVETCDSI